MPPELKIPSGHEIQIASEVDNDTTTEVFRVDIGIAVIVCNTEQLGQIDSRIRSILGMRPSTEPGRIGGGSLSHAS